MNAVYTGFEETEYTSNRPAPWREQHDAEKVIVYDVIQPKATAYWFYGLSNAYDFDLEQLDTSMVTVMTSMFSYAGSEVPDTVSVRGIKDWDVSKVKYFGSIFRGFGRMASVVNFEDISGWNTSSAISMVQFFCAIAENSGVYVDCSNWNVANVQQHWDFSEQAGGTIIEPHWN